MYFQYRHFFCSISPKYVDKSKQDLFVFIYSLITIRSQETIFFWRQANIILFNLGDIPNPNYTVLPNSYSTHLSERMGELRELLVQSDWKFCRKFLACTSQRWGERMSGGWKILLYVWTTWSVLRGFELFAKFYLYNLFLSILQFNL